MKILSKNSVICKNHQLIESDIDGEKVMMSLESGDYYGLDDIGTRIWQLIEKPIKVLALIDTLIKEYDVSREECSADVMKFLGEIAKNNLIDIIEG